MNDFLPRRWWIGLGILAWLILLSCQSFDLTAQAQPTVTETRPRPTFTRVLPTMVPTPVPTIRPPTRPPAPRATTRPPTARPVPTRTPTPAPPTAIIPTATPDPDAGYFYRVSKVSCVASDNTRIEGTITDNKMAQNGVMVRVSGSPFGPKAMEDAITGLNPADNRRNDPAFVGKYRLGLAEGTRIEGNWFVFAVNAAGEPLSRNVNVQTSSAGCNTATIDFAR